MQNALAIKETELQEVRYAKALIAFNNDEYKNSLHFIQTNLNYKHPHKESIDLLAKIHEKMGNHKKAIRVYYYMLKSLDGFKYVKLKNNTQFKSTLGDYKKIDQRTLSYFFKLGNLFISYHDKSKKKVDAQNIADRVEKKKKKHKLYEELKMSKTVRIKLVSPVEKRKQFLHNILNKAEKYFLLCKINKYSNALTNFLLGLIEKKRDNTYLAREFFNKSYHEQFLASDTKQILTKEDESLKEILEFYIGDTLFKEGHKELATNYFKSLSRSTSTQSLKTYSNLYIDSLSGSSLTLTLLVGAGIDSNPLSIDPRTYTNSEYNATKPFTTYEFNSFYSTNQKNNWAWTGYGSFTEYTFLDTNFDSGDQQTMFISSEFKYINMPKGILKSNSYVALTRTKQGDSPVFSAYSYTVSNTLSYDHYFNWGTLNLSLPFSNTTTTTDDGTAESTAISGAFTVTPWGYGKYFTPSYGFSYGLTTTNDILVSGSTNYQFTFSNQFAIDSKTSAYGTLFLKYDPATNPDDTALTISLSGVWLRSLNYILKNLILQVKLDSNFITYSETDKNRVKKHRLTTNLQYSF